jgi:hypothetical protein
MIRAKSIFQLTLGLSGQVPDILDLSRFLRRLRLKTTIKAVMIKAKSSFKTDFGPFQAYAGNLRPFALSQ